MAKAPNEYGFEALKQVCHAVFCILNELHLATNVREIGSIKKTPAPFILHEIAVATKSYKPCAVNIFLHSP